MRILHILDHSIPVHDGYSFRTLAILREQRRLGWETEQITSSKHEAGGPPDETVDGFHFFRTAVSSATLARLPIVGQWAVVSDLTKRLEAVIPEVRPDVLHAHSPVLNGMAALRLARRLRLPLVYEVRTFWEDAAVDQGTNREGDLRYRLIRSLETRVMRGAQAVTTICDGLRDDIVQRGIPADKITVIPNAVDLAQFQAQRQYDADLAKQTGVKGNSTLGFCGSYYAYEGLHVLLNAMPAILDQCPDTRLLLVGGGQEEAALRRQAEELQLTHAVKFCGRVPHDQIQRYYGLVDIMVYPRTSMRLTELVTPLKPIEAMARGCLVAASDVGGHRELIQDHLTGSLFKAGEPRALAAKVTDLLQHRDNWERMRTAARRFVEQERTWTESVGRYREVYAQALGKRS